MAQSSCIEHPANYPYFRIRLEYMIITGRNACAAACLDVLEFYTNNERITDSGGWIQSRGKAAVLRNLMELYSDRTVDRALLTLVDLGFLETYDEPGKTKLLRLNIDKVQEAVNASCPKIEYKSWSASRKRPP